MNQNNDYEKIYNDLIQPYHKIISINNNTLYLGNQSTAGGMPDKWNYSKDDYDNICNNLKNLNVKSIVCCADNIEIFPNNFTYLQIPMRNHCDFSIKESVDKAYNFIVENIKNGSVFVHCNAGVTRSASTVIYFLMKYKEWDFKTAHDYVKNIRSCIDVDIFENQLMSYS